MDIFIPDLYQKSIYDINYKKLKNSGIKCLLFDLDNTLVPYTTKEPNKKIKDLFQELSSDFKVIIMSNSGKNRLRPFKEKLNVDVAYNSHKPLKKKYKKIFEIYNFKPEQIAAIGDQLMTDVFGGNRVGITTVFVNRIGPVEPITTRFNRIWERKLIKKFNKKGVLIPGEYYD
ncbi:MAG: YqeG family HAD IIIA-type phosphatase [Bacilli bacterium]|nr:YqeG family HAD IIIA-type phosphatase [Bacilli bacterium]